MVGRKPKPTELKKLAGNPGKRPLNAAEPQPPPLEDLKPTKGMIPQEGITLFRRLAPMLDELSLVTELDRQVLEIMCVHYAYARKAEKILRKEGVVGIGSNDNDIKHPAHTVFMDHSKQFLAYAREFGMSPSARTRISMPKAEEEADIADWLFGKPVKVGEDASR